MNQVNKWEEVTERTCRVCHKTKPRTEFYKHRYRPGGIQYECKECQKHMRRVNYHFVEKRRAKEERRLMRLAREETKRRNEERGL